MRPTAPSGPSARSSRRTGWSPAPWRPGGKPGSPRSPTPSRPWQPPRPPSRRCLTGPAWRNSPPACPRCGTPPPPPPRDRKRLLRTLIADVTLLPEANRGKARIGIRWHTGAADEIVIDRPRPTGVPAPTPTPATGLIRELGPVTSNTDLVAILAQRGYRTGAGRPFDIKAVQWVRHAYQIPSPSPCRDTEISVADAARRLGCSPGVVYYWIETRQLDSPPQPRRQALHPLDTSHRGGLPARITSSGHLNPAARRTRPRQHR